MRHAPHDKRAEQVRSVRAPTLDDLEPAWQTVHSVLEPTPLVASPIAPNGSLKLETLQPTGSFKVRGGGAGVSALPQDQRAVTADYEAAEKYALELGAAEGVSFVSPYNDPLVIAGQATIGRELDSQAPGELTVVAPVGGGGLLAGLALWARSRPGVRLAGVESSESRGISAAVAAGHIVHVPVGDTIADGLAGNLEPGSVTVGLVAGAQLVAVDDDELRAAMRWLFANHGLVTEGSGAAGIAAVLSGKVDIAWRLVVVVTGRNIAADRFAKILRGG